MATKSKRSNEAHDSTEEVIDGVEPIVAKAKAEKTTRVMITAPDLRTIQFILPGTSHLCVCRFGAKAMTEMMETQAAGSTAKSKKIRKPKDFKGLFQEAQYRSKEGWCGVHAACIRCAAISACRLVGYKMTLAKLSIFTVADGYDKDDGTPLIRIYGPQPEMWVAPVRNANGDIDLRPRPRWKPGEWELRPRIKYDADQFTVTDISNLIMRVGMQVGICEGRPDSRKSAGLEYGLFSLKDQVNRKEAA